MEAEKPQKAAPLPRLPWRKSEFRASREEPVIEITDADDKPIAWIPKRWQEMTEGNRAYEFPQSEALAALLLRAPQVEQAARDAETLIAGYFGENAPQVVQAVLERLRAALGEAK